VLVILGIAAAIAVTATIVIVGIVDRSDDLTTAFDDAQEQLADVSTQWDLDELLEQIRTGDEASSTVRDGIGRGVTTVLGSAAAFASGLVLGVVLLYYLLKDGASLVRTIVTRRTPESSAQTERVLRQAAASIRGYFRGRTILALVQGVAVALALWALDVPLAGSIGVVNFVGAFVPYLGAVLGGAFAVLMGLAGGGVSLAIYALAVVLFVNLVLENLLEPKVMGSSLNLHPVMVLLATVGGGLLAGIVGLILGAPLLAIGRDLFGELRASAFFGRPSGDGPSDPAPTATAGADAGPSGDERDAAASTGDGAEREPDA
jgi:predicted PurR-regulated permease PerM